MSNARKWRRAVFSLTFAVLAGAVALNLAAPAGAYVTPRLKPPAPGPLFVTPEDLARLDQIRADLKSRDFAKARGLAATVTDRNAQSLALWYYFYAEDPLVSLSDADAFLDSHPDWPMSVKIQRHVEERIPDTAPAADVLAFFDGRAPVSAAGKVQLARAKLAAGEEDAAVFHLRDAWINDSFTVSDEKRFLANYGSRLNEGDHAARVDRLLWRRQVTNARRVFSRLTSSERRKAEARAALLLQASSAERLYDRLPAQERADAGVMHAAIRYFRRREEEPRAVMIARNATTDPVVARNGPVLWDETQLLMRWALREKQFADAYAMAAGHALAPGSTDFSEAEFNAGWIALRYLGDPARAETHFAALTASVSAPISKARGYYWLARAAEARGAGDIAATRYRQASQYIYTFYGQLAAEKIGGAAQAQTFGVTPPSTEADKAMFASRPLVRALRILTDVEDDHAYLIFAYAADDILETPGEYLELAELNARMGATHATVRAGKVAVRRNAFAPEVAYPLVFIPEEASRFAPAELILGLSRQESEFNPRAFSRAGARGMMQLIPSTAQLTARKEGLRYSRSALLDDPTYNLTLGSAHLSHLLDRYDGSYIMTLAAYNAGPHRVTQWVERYGDPRSAGVDPIDWVENIPFSETRNYVQRVLENMQVYRSRVAARAISGQLASDLERGGGANRAGLLPAVKSARALPPVPERIDQLAENFLVNDTLIEPPTPNLSPAPDGADPAQAPASSGAERDAKLDAEEGETSDAPAPKAPTAPSSTAPSSTAKATPVTPAAVIAREETPLTQPAATTSAPATPPSSARDIAPGPSSAYASDPAFDIVSGDGEENDSSFFDGVSDSVDGGDCQTYAEFIADIGQEEAAAADLNAGMLAELKGGGASCD